MAERWTGSRYLKVEGTNELRRALRQLEDKTAAKELGQTLKSEFRVAGSIVVASARDEIVRGRTAASKAGRERTPTGRLGSTVRAKGALRGATVLAGGVRGVRYAGPINYGWPRKPNPARNIRGGPIQANRFLNRALHGNRDLIVSVMEKGVARLTEQVAAMAKTS